MTKVKIVFDDLTEDEAYALAQMCKRMIWDDFSVSRPTGRSATTWTARRSSCGAHSLKRGLIRGRSSR